MYAGKFGHRVRDRVSYVCVLAWLFHLAGTGQLVLLQFLLIWSQWKTETVSSWTPTYLHRLRYVLAPPHVTSISPSLLCPLPTSDTTSKTATTHGDCLTCSHNHTGSDPYHRCVRSLRVIWLHWWNSEHSR